MDKTIVIAQNHKNDKVVIGNVPYWNNMHDKHLYLKVLATRIEAELFDAIMLEWSQEDKALFAHTLINKSDMVLIAN